MRIGLVDVDSHNFPNLALMKLSAWHKAQGHTVERANAFSEYDRVYMSKVFDDSPDYTTYIKADEIIKGGRAYDKSVKLPAEVETMMPDYNLYNITDTAYGHLTRGCPRGCKFCDVQNIEGKKAYKVADLRQFWNGQKNIKLLDANLLACPDKYELLQQLVDSKAWIDFTQGLDIRLMDDKAIDLIMQIKVKMMHFAWDMAKDEKIIIKNLMRYKEVTNCDERKARVYVLVNFDTNMNYDLHRIYTLRAMGYDPYIMRYDKKTASRETNRMARWVNNKFIFSSCARFEDYGKKVSNDL